MTKEEKKKGGWWRRLIQGRWLPLSVYKKNMTGVVIVVSLFVLYISFKFSVQMKQAEIISLREALANERTDMVKASAAYSSRILESEMTDVLDTLKIPLRVAEQPPYYLDSGKEAGDEE